MNIYLENGYLNMKLILDMDMPFVFIVGARATGKTYGALKYMYEENHKFMYMRRTQTQADLINKPEFTPFKSLNNDMGWNVVTKSLSKYNAGFYNVNVDGEYGNPLGFTSALSTISNIRGFDASDLTKMIYDEFIPEKHERPLKNEASALFNAYETINRNRELKGLAPMQLICLANASDVGNPLFLELGLVKKANEMRAKTRNGSHQEVYINRDRGIMLIVLDESPISAKKADTALYRLTKGTSFADMAINNNFSNEEVGRIKPKPIKEYRPVVTIGEITIYTHKSKRSYYVSTHKTGSPPSFGIGEVERARFRRAYSWIWDEYMEDNMEFEEYLCEILLTKYYN